MFWKYGVYLNPDVEGPPSLVAVDGILSQACRLTITPPPKHQEDDDERDESAIAPELRKIWATCGLTRVGAHRSMSCLSFADFFTLVGRRSVLNINF